jgi:ATP-dependent DNA helicase UvrD/PcrA
MQLNPAQNEAVKTIRGPLLVLAGAGTGKTRVVTLRIAELIARGTRPSRILGVTFTNKAAAEMQQRVTAELGRRRKEKPELSTFHSLCVRILRRQIEHLGYPKKFAIYDRGDQESIARNVLRDIKAADATLRPGDLLFFIGNWKTACLRPNEAANAAQNDREHLAAAGYRRYQGALKAAGAVDFDDLLLLTEELFSRFPKIRQEEASRYDHLLVDEYQDTNGSQYRIVRALAEPHRNLCVVGDDDQSIYGWRGAEVTHILSFKKDWPDAKVVRLETNYRSTHEIIAWANTLIAFNKHRHGKILRGTLSGENPRVLQYETAEEEAEEVVADIFSRIKDKGKKARDIAILFRTNEQPRVFEQELRRMNVPYVLLGGQSFYDRKEVRDILAYLKMLQNPRDEISLLRIINLPPRGIGQTSTTKVIETAVAEGRTIWEALDDPVVVNRLAPSARKGIAGFLKLAAKFRRDLQRRPTADLVRSLVEEIRYRDELTRIYQSVEEQDSRWSSVEDVVNAAAFYDERAEHPNLAEFLDEASLMGSDESPDKEKQLQQDAVALMTMHAAKGLEFEEVYMVGMEEGVLPHRRSLDPMAETVDEERRLCYVGVTRAQRRLTLTLPLSRKKWGKDRPTVPSRFLYEVTGQADNPNYATTVKLASQLDKLKDPRAAIAAQSKPQKKKAAKKKAVKKKAAKKKVAKKKTRKAAATKRKKATGKRPVKKANPKKRPS